MRPTTPSPRRPVAVKPPPLRRGSRVALLAPSSGLAAKVAPRVEAAAAVLRSLGLEPTLYPSIRSSFGHTSASAVERAREINDAFADPDIHGMICAIGGASANALLDRLDYAAIARRPKVFVGFSDITVLQAAMYARAGLVSFQGPMVLTQFGEYPCPHDYTLQSFRDVTFGRLEHWQVMTPPQWTDEFLEWTSGQYRERPRVLQTGEPRTWLQRGTAAGHMVGGCLPSLLQLRATDYLPDLDSAVLLLELPEGHRPGIGLPPAEVEAMLDDLRLSKPFHGIRGVMIGRLYGYDPATRASILAMMCERLQWVNGPVVANVPFGHTDPIATLPIGCQVMLDADGDCVAITERATQPPAVTGRDS